MSVNHSPGVLFMTFYDVILTKLNNSKINQEQFVFIRREMGTAAENLSVAESLFRKYFLWQNVRPEAKSS